MIISDNSSVSWGPEIGNADDYHWVWSLFTWTICTSSSRVSLLFTLYFPKVTFYCCQPASSQQKSLRANFSLDSNFSLPPVSSVIRSYTLIAPKFTILSASYSIIISFLQNNNATLSLLAFLKSLLPSHKHPPAYTFLYSTTTINKSKLNADHVSRILLGVRSMCLLASQFKWSLSLQP